MSSDIKHNAEGYKDSTAYRAIMSVSAEKRKQMAIQSEHDKLIKTLKYIINLSGFALDGRIKLKHKQSGRRFE